MQNILTAGNATSNLSTAAGDDGTFKIVVGPNGSQVDGLTLSSTGTLSAPALQQGGVATPRMVLSTAQNTTSGANIDFTSIPSWVKKITVMFNGVSTNGTSNKRIQIGSGSILSSGYVSSAVSLQGAGNALVSDTAGFVITAEMIAAGASNGAVTLALLGSNTWVLTSALVHNSRIQESAGSVTLSGTLDRLRLTTVNGTDTFDAGSVNILYEG